MSNLFSITINCVVFSTNINLNKRFVLSLEENTIKLPSFELSTQDLDNIEHKIMDYLKSILFVNDLELLPQLININSKILSKDHSHLNIIYGFIVSHTNSLNNSHWVEFELLQEQTYSPLLFEVMQKLK
jgi:hypothetical protein